MPGDIAKAEITVYADGGMNFKLSGEALLFNALAGSIDIVKGRTLSLYAEKTNLDLNSNKQAFDNSKVTRENKEEVQLERGEAINELLDAQSMIQERMQAIRQSAPGTLFKLNLQNLKEI